MQINFVMGVWELEHFSLIRYYIEYDKIAFRYLNFK